MTTPLNHFSRILLPILQSVAWDSTGKHSGVGAPIERRLSVEYPAIPDLMPFSHQDRSLGGGFGLQFEEHSHSIALADDLLYF